MVDLQAFLTPTDTIESEHPVIRELAREVAAGALDPHDAARRLFERVRDGIRYSIYNPFFLREHYRATGILERGHGYCVQKAVVLCTLARAVSIPARLVFCDIVNHRIPGHIVEMMGTNVFTYHCYTQLHLGGRWVSVTPSFDRTTCADNDFPLVEFDGHNDAILPSADGSGRRFVEYLRQHGSFADVPMEPMLQAWEDEYGKERVELWKQAYLDGLVQPGIKP